MSTETKHLGTFTLTSSEMYIADPCFKPKSCRDGILKNCVRGLWNAGIQVSDEGELGNRNALIAVWKEGADESLLSMLHKGMRVIPNGFRSLDTKIFVSSARAGFFDKAHYQCNDSVDIHTVTHDFSSWVEASDFYKGATCSATSL